MKRIVIILILIYTNLFAQDFDSLMTQGKEIFYSEKLEKDYSFAAKLFEQAIKIKPNNAEAHYFLGYSYSRMNSSDGTFMNNVNKDLTIKSSERFEHVNLLEPK